METTKLKIQGFVWKATIRETDGKKEVVTLEKLDVVKGMEQKITYTSTDASILAQKAKEVSESNKKAKTIKLSIHRPGDTFNITLRIITQDNEDTTPTT